MADDICAQDQALIAAALAAGKVQQIPRGVSGEPMPVWTRRRDGWALSDGQGSHWRATISSLHKGGRKAGYVTPEVAARRIRVRDMLVKGMNCVEIGRVENAPPEVIRRDRKALRARGFAV